MAKRERTKKQAPKRETATYEGDIQIEAAAAHLEALARGLRDSHLPIQTGTESLDLEVGSRVELSIAAKPARGKGKSSLRLSLTWNVPEAVTALSAPSLAISSGRDASWNGSALSAPESE